MLRQASALCAERRPGHLRNPNAPPRHFPSDHIV